MLRLLQTIPAALAAAALAPAAVAQTTPLDYSGVASAIRLDQVLTGHLTAVNGQYKMRASQIYIDPAGYVGPHQHAGPGIRYVLDGEVTLVEGGKAEVFRAGDFFYEAGDTTHRIENRGSDKAIVLQVELLPAAAGRGTTFAAPEPRRP